MHNLTDNDLIKQALQADEKAFQLLVEKYQQQVFSTCMGFAKNKQDAEDIAQEVFVEVFQSLGKFRHQSAFSTWLYRITVNKSLNHQRKQKFLNLFKSNNEEVTYALEADHHLPDAGLVQKDNRRLLKKALAALPKNQRVAFILSKYQELSGKEIAAVMNLSLSAVEALVHRSRKNLKAYLLKNGE
ncbi:RNA polymerase sigma factor [Marinilabiliaceae bacterium JC017]|nr:RNA polymerase sigma factor [Marinilabiliaceae bacterium JC017]